MSTLSRSQVDKDRDANHQPETSTSTRTTSSRALRYLLGALRLSLGWVFLWAFVDKLFGLGHETGCSLSVWP